jgi:hypothetical protein
MTTINLAWRAGLVASTLLALAAPALGCGSERWNVKVARDRDAARIATESQPITVARLGRLPAPPDPDRRESSRWRPVETTTYRVTARLTAIRHERDGDLHLILEDGPAHMIAEAPSSRCVGGSRFSAQLRAVRRAISGRFGYVRRAIYPDIPVTVTEVGFFNRLHEQDGVAPNGIELHPVLSITFGQ